MLLARSPVLHHGVPAQYSVGATTVAAAWILRHPAQMQLTREEWYRLYLVAGHPPP